MSKTVYFVGIGGIGMSAIARYFMHEGAKVALVLHLWTLAEGLFAHSCLLYTHTP